MTLYHYCSNHAFEQIVKSQSIWLSELRLSNDSMEGTWIKNIFEELCLENDLDEKFIPLISDYLDTIINASTGFGFCMSKDPDVLSQWRGYAKDGKGVSIGFSKRHLNQSVKEVSETHAIELIEAVYTTKKQKSIVLPMLDRIVNSKKNLKEHRGKLKNTGTSWDNFSAFLGKFRDHEREIERLLALANVALSLFTLKNPHFAEEKEIRLVLYHLKRNVSGIARDDPKFFEYTARDDHLVPYVDLPLINNNGRAITEVWLGPKNITPPEIITGFLEKNGFFEVNIHQSHVPYR